MRDKRVKGCLNTRCEAFKKIRYKADDDYCSKCGSELSFVCTKCGTPLAFDDVSVRVCAKCRAKAEDRKHIMLGAGKAALGLVPGFVGLIVRKK